MKILILVLMLSGSLARASGAPIEVEGSKAEALTRALIVAGSFSEGAAGKFFNVANDLRCDLRGNAAPPRHWECNFRGVGETGAEQVYSVEGPVARKLMKKLTEAGSPEECGAGKCFVALEQVQCALYQAEEPATYRCSITPRY